MPQLSLQEERDLALAATTALVRRVWTEFDAARDVEPEVSPEVRELLSTGLPNTPMANAAVNVASGNFDYADSIGERMVGDKRLFSAGVVLAGRWWHPT